MCGTIRRLDFVLNVLGSDIWGLVQELGWGRSEGGSAPSEIIMVRVKDGHTLSLLSVFNCLVKDFYL